MPSGAREGKRKLQDEVNGGPGKMSKKSLPSASELPKLWKLMIKEDSDMSTIQLRLFNSRKHRASNQSEQARLMQQLDALRATWKTLSVDIDSDVHSLMEKNNKLNSLRFWGNTVKFVDLPNELLEMVFLYIGYAHQQRLVRVCRHWKQIITCQLDHVYIDSKTIFDARRDKQSAAISFTCGEVFGRIREEFRDASTVKYERTWRMRMCGWKYKNPTVRTVTFNGTLIANILPAGKWVSILADRYPNLAVVNFTQIVIGSCELPLKEWMTKNPSVRVVVSQSVVKPFPTGLRMNHVCKRVIACRYNSFLRVPTLILSSPEQYELAINRAVWPFADDQTDWLAKQAPRLGAEFLEFVFQGLSYGEKFSAAPNIMCMEHKNLCRHLDGSFYKDKLDGQVRNLLAVLLMCREKAPMKDPPPCAFRFERFQMIKGHRVLVPKF